MKILICSNQARSLRLFWGSLLTTIGAKGHNLCLLVPNINIDTSEQDLQQLDCLIKSCSCPKQSKLHFFYLQSRGRNLISEMRSFWSLYSILRQEKPQIIFATTIKPILYLSLALRLMGKNYSARMYCCITGLGYVFEQQSFFYKYFLRKLYKYALKQVHTIFFQNPHDLEFFAENNMFSPCEKHKAKLIAGTGVNTNFYYFYPNYPINPTFLLMARLLKSKGIEDFVLAAKIVKSRHPNARFQLLGKPQTGPDCIDLQTINSWHKQNILEYLGFLEDVRPAIASASIMVLPSLREGIPCAILEGMSMGRAAIVSSVPGCLEVVKDGENGVFVPAKNPLALADAMEHFIRFPEKIVSMGEYARNFVHENFKAQDVADKLVYEMHLS